MPLPGQPPQNPGGGKPAPKPSNAKTPAEFAMQELKKTAASRGIPVEKLIAQMVQEYLKEGKDEREVKEAENKPWDGKI